MRIDEVTGQKAPFAALLPSAVQRQQRVNKEVNKLISQLAHRSANAEEKELATKVVKQLQKRADLKFQDQLNAALQRGVSRLGRARRSSPN